MSFRSDIRAMTRRAVSAKPVAGCSGAALACTIASKILGAKILGGLLLLSVP
jgi:hypothetical protein